MVWVSVAVAVPPGPLQVARYKFDPPVPLCWQLPELPPAHTLVCQVVPPFVERSKTQDVALVALQDTV